MVSDRDRGFLSKRDRQYLRDELDVESKSSRERMVRKDIRERTRNAFLDFSLVIDKLQEKDREMIFESERQIINDPFPRGLADTIAFIFVGVTEVSQFVSGERAYSEGNYRGDGDFQSPEFLQLLWKGLRKGYRKFGITLDEIELRTQGEKTSDITDIQRKLEAGETLDYRELMVLSEREEVDTQALTEFIREHLGYTDSGADEYEPQEDTES